MKLPNNEKVIVPKEKLKDYILSDTHLIGKFKAKYFNSMGFNEVNVDIFERSIRNIAKKQDITDMLETPYGTKYVIDGEIKSPSGKVSKVRTVWIIESGQKRPRFVTIYPV